MHDGLRYSEALRRGKRRAPQGRIGANADMQMADAHILAGRYLHGPGVDVRAALVHADAAHALVLVEIEEQRRGIGACGCGALDRIRKGLDAHRVEPERDPGSDERQVERAVHRQGDDLAGLPGDFPEADRDTLGLEDSGKRECSREGGAGMTCHGVLLVTQGRTIVR